MDSKRYIAFLFSACVVAALPLRASAQDVPNALLEVSVNGTVYKGEAEWDASGASDAAAASKFIDQNILHVPHGGSVQLRVDLVAANGQKTDVTADPSTHYSAVTDWNLDVSGTGLVTQKANPGYTQANLANDKSGQVIVWYKSGNILGYNSIQLQID
ncbi:MULTISPECIES: hypothetical protein [Paraburkholderia]|uniref:hypothetical protein n=1 Tax=Paraburkholderia TaxID=1822464 RepID=UPI002253151E|nr:MULTISPECIES: hypothetical protein [Paraburkholderia]MCX4166289.1 hypothetical protein [Paraburkholderia megapolitana]MDN7161779.1 hypothetical protein [Paraburkholderia sp. CHISQ3]MDQ6498827.1 hypothetical protein [Paraburkholderia megapolitana]